LTETTLLCKIFLRRDGTVKTRVAPPFHRLFASYSARKWNNAMAFVPVPLCVGVEMRMLLDSQHIENTFAVSKGIGWIPADVPVLFNELLLWWTVDLAPSLTQSITLQEVQITDLSSATGFAFTIPAPVPKPAGGRVGTPLPNNVAGCITLRTAKRGRSFRGRNYVPGLVVNDVTNNTIAAARITALETAYNSLITRMVGLGAGLVVISRFTAGAPRVTGVATVVTAAGFTDATVDSQRRRLPGRGR
jgi:hypothetical protein